MESDAWLISRGNYGQEYFPVESIVKIVGLRFCVSSRLGSLRFCSEGGCVGRLQVGLTSHQTRGGVAKKSPDWWLGCATDSVSLQHKTPQKENLVPEFGELLLRSFLYRHFAAMDSRNFPLSPQDRRILISKIFANPGSDFELIGTSQSYFSYYQRMIETCDNSLTNSHEQIANLIAILKDPVRSRESIQNTLQTKLHKEEGDEGEESVEKSINLGVRLLLMVPTGDFATLGRSITLSGETKLSWNGGTIRDLVCKEFTPQHSMKESIKLERIFNATNLEHIAGIDVRWTSNLADHLRMRDDDKAVEIFHYATFLRLHTKWWVLNF
jgi:hypothetical protein